MQLLSEELYTVYLCTFIEQDKIVSRHYTSGYSTCEKAEVRSITFIESLLSPEQAKALKDYGELIITNIEQLQILLEKIVSQRQMFEKYLREPNVYIVIRRHYST